MKNIYDLDSYMDAIEMHDSLRTVIIDEMSDSHRHYHTTNHLCRMMAKLDLYDRGREKIYACLLHDIVYDVKRNDNEERSAMAAYAWGLHTCLDEEQLQYACHLIRCTGAHMDHYDSSDKHVRDFIMADLSIFYEPWDIYRWYMNGIRKEYAHIPDETFVPARLQMLKNFRDIFRDAENISREIEILEF